MTAIVDSSEKLLGVFTDGDLRRVFETGIDLHQARITELMTSDSITTRKNLLAAEAVHLMEENNINALLVVDEQQKLIGALNMHTLLRAGVV